MRSECLVCLLDQQNYIPNYDHQQRNTVPSSVYGKTGSSSEMISLAFERLAMLKNPSADSFTLKKSKSKEMLGTRDLYP